MVPGLSRTQAWNMTTTPPDAPTGPPEHPAGEEGPRVTRDEIRDLGRLRRSTADRKVAGVAGGLARHLDIDPLILRVAFVVLVFFGGAGIILYGACWLLVPEDGSDSAAITLDERSRTVALLLVGVLAAFALLGDTWGVFWFPWPVAVIAVVVWLLLSRRDHRRSRSAGPGTPHPPGAGGGPAAAPAADAATAYETSQHQASPYQTAPQQAPPYQAYQVPPVQRDPRKRGPILFWFTLALIALAVGVLGILDVAGLGVADAAYPALAVAITGVMLLVGSVYGRAGGLILLGLLTTVGLVGATATAKVDRDTDRHTPTTAAAVDDSYDFNAGELVLDLSQVSDIEELDGRTIDIDGGIGRIEVIVPDDVDAVIRGHVGGPGHVEAFGDEDGGVDNRVTREHDGGVGAPTITIDAELGVGEIYATSE